MSVNNTGKFDEDEVVQVYMSTKDASIETLRGFKRIFLSSGEAQTIEFELSTKSFSIINEKGERVLEPCMVDIYVGDSLPYEKTAALTGEKPIKTKLHITGKARVIEY